MKGAEALVRWRHPVRGLVSPAEFIPLAEASGAILALGNWVLQTACAQLAVWSRDPAMASLSLAVNVSARQFNQPGFVDQVLEVLVGTGAHPGKLKLELTEGLLLENTEAVIATISALKQAGVGFSLDDFGTGYSSLSIDQSFVRDLLNGSNDIAIVRACLALAGCFAYQGYLYGKSLPLERFEQSVRRPAHARQQEAA